MGRFSPSGITYATSPGFDPDAAVQNFMAAREHARRAKQAKAREEREATAFTLDMQRQGYTEVPEEQLEAERRDGITAPTPGQVGRFRKTGLSPEEQAGIRQTAKEVDERTRAERAAAVRRQARDEALGPQRNLRMLWEVDPDSAAKITDDYRLATPKPPEPRNIDPLSPQGIDATVTREQRLSGIPARRRAGGGGNRVAEEVRQRRLLALAGVLGRQIDDTRAAAGRPPSRPDPTLATPEVFGRYQADSVRHAAGTQALQARLDSLTRVHDGIAGELAVDVLPERRAARDREGFRREMAELVQLVAMGRARFKDDPAKQRAIDADLAEATRELKAKYRIAP